MKKASAKIRRKVKVRFCRELNNIEYKVEAKHASSSRGNKASGNRDGKSTMR